MGRLDDLKIIFEQVETMMLMRRIKNKHKHSRLGFMAEDNYNVARKEVVNTIKKYNRDHKENVNIQIFERILG